MPHSRDRRVGRCHPVADRRCPVSLALCAGAYWVDVCRPTVRSGGSRVHFPSSSSRLAPAAGSLDRRATGTRPVHSPFFVMWPGVWAEVADDVKRRTASPVRARRSGAPAVADSAGSADPFANAGRAERSIRVCWSRCANAGTLRTTRPAADRREVASSPHDSAAWRRGWDSNPRSLSTQRFSRAPPSAARPPLRCAGYQRPMSSPLGPRGSPASGPCAVTDDAVDRRRACDARRAARAWRRRPAPGSRR